jgi:hypothetical protein
MNTTLRNAIALLLLVAGLSARSCAAQVRAVTLNDRLSIDISNGEVNLGEMKVGSVSVSTAPVLVKNTGETGIDLKLSLSDPAGWSAVSYSTGTPGNGQYRLFGMFTFKGMQGLRAADYSQDGIITKIPLAANASGRGIPPNKERNLYFRFDACGMLPSTEEYLGITINITASPTASRRCDKTIGKWGGELSFNDGTSLTIPALALAFDREISMVELDEDEAPPRRRPRAPRQGFGVPALAADLEDTEPPVCAFALYPDGLILSKPAEASLLYSRSKLERLGVGDQDLRAFCWDGNEWLLISGSVDPDNSIFKTQLSHFSYYALFPAANLAADDYRPVESIITPATRDNINDSAFFPNQSTDYEIFIYDITGRQVRKLNKDGTAGTRWDGRDELGNIVESGVYIYQFKADAGGARKLISGTIAVAK